MVRSIRGVITLSFANALLNQAMLDSLLCRCLQNNQNRNTPSTRGISLKVSLRTFRVRAPYEW